MWSQRHGTGVGFRAARALGKVVLTTANQEREKGAGSNRTLGRYNLQIQGRYGMHWATSLNVPQPPHVALQAKEPAQDWEW